MHYNRPRLVAAALMDVVSLDGLQPSDITANAAQDESAVEEISHFRRQVNILSPRALLPGGVTMATMTSGFMKWCVVT